MNQKKFRAVFLFGAAILLLALPVAADSTDNNPSGIDSIDELVQQAEMLIRYQADLAEAEMALGTAEEQLLAWATENGVNARSPIIRNRLLRIGQARIVLQEARLVEQAQNAPGTAVGPPVRTRRRPTETASASRQAEEAAVEASPASETAKAAPAAAEEAAPAAEEVAAAEEAVPAAADATAEEAAPASETAEVAPAGVEAQPAEVEATAAAAAAPAVAPAAASSAAITAFRPEINEINSILRQARTAIYSRDELEQGEADLATAEARLDTLETYEGEDFVQADFDRARSRLQDYRVELESKKAKLAADIATQEQQAQAEAEKQQAASQAASEAEVVFTRWQSSLPSLYTLNRSIARYSEIDEVAEIMPQAQEIFGQTATMLQEMEAVLPDNQSRNDFMEVNQAAKDMNLRSILGDIESQMEKAKGRVDAYVSGLLNEADSEVFSMEYYNRLDLAAKGLQLITNRVELAKKVKPDDEEIAAEAERILQDAQAAWEKAYDRFSNARMDEDAYSGSDGQAIKEKLAELYSARYDGTVAKVVITSEDWQERIVAEITNDDTISANAYLYLSAQIAVEEDGQYTVFPMTFRRSWTGEGNEFGPIEIRSVGVSFPMPAENL